MNKRILWVDVAKAIGIYFIVLGHVLTTGKRTIASTP